MLWFIYALIAAVFVSLGSILSKKELFHKHALEFATLRSMCMAIFAIILLFFLDPEISISTLLIIYLISLFATSISFLKTKSLRHLDISIFSPLTNMSPIFLLIFAFFILGEKLSGLQFLGLALMIVGSYTLEVDHNFKNFFTPIKKVIKSKYQLLLLFTLVFMSLGAIIDKYAVTYLLKPLVYLCYMWIFIGFNFIVIDFFKFGLKDVKKDLRKNILPIIAIAFFGIVGNAFYLTALSLQLVTLVVPIKRLSTLFDTIIGGSLFHEKGIKLKILACLTLILGTYFLSL